MKLKKLIFIGFISTFVVAMACNSKATSDISETETVVSTKESASHVLYEDKTDKISDIVSDIAKHTGEYMSLKGNYLKEKTAAGEEIDAVIASDENGQNSLVFFILKDGAALPQDIGGKNIIVSGRLDTIFKNNASYIALTDATVVLEEDVSDSE